MNTQKNTIFIEKPESPIHFRTIPDVTVRPGQNCYVPVRRVPMIPLGLAFVLMGIAFSVGYWFAIMTGVVQ